jgi:hypothetical protein
METFMRFGVAVQNEAVQNEAVEIAPAFPWKLWFSCG